MIPGSSWLKVQSSRVPISLDQEVTHQEPGLFINLLFPFSLGTRGVPLGVKPIFSYTSSTVTLLLVTPVSGDLGAYRQPRIRLSYPVF